MKNIFILLFLIPSLSFSLTFKDGKIVEENKFEFDKNSTTVIPKYFFAHVLNSNTCIIKGVHGDGSYGEKYSELDLDLTNEKNFNYLMKLTEYDWQKEHEDRSNSLSVNHEKHTSRLALLHGSIINAIISNNMELQSDSITKIMTAWAESGVFLNTMTLEDINKLKEQGKADRLCYGGSKGDTKAKCLPHKVHEAHIYGASFIINAYLVKDQFSKEQFILIDKYIQKLYEKYIFPWADKHLNDDRAFIQMADGTISVIAYLAWKNKLEEVDFWFDRGIKKASKVIYEDGYIHNNSFRGVRDVWYHSQGVNNLLGLLAITEVWNYNKFPAELKQRIFKTIDVLNLGLTDVEKYRERKDPSGLKNFSTDQKDAAYHVHQMAISLDWLIENFSDRDPTHVRENYMWKAKKSQYFVDRNFGFEPKCMN